MVHSVEVGHQVVDVLDAEVVDGAKLDGQRNLTQSLGCSARYNPPERRVNEGEVFFGEA